MNIKLDKVTLIGIDCVGPGKLQAVMNLCQREIDFGAVKLLTSKSINDERLINIPGIRSLEEFSIFCLKDLVDYVDTDFVLLVQRDGFILNPQSWDKSFLNYDYIGSPWVVKDWSINDFDFPEKLRGELIVGNGGFCIRSKKFLEVSSMLFKNGVIKRFHPEDIAISVWYREIFESHGINFAPTELSKQFALEGGDYVYKDQFGFHGYYTNIDDWAENNKDLEFIVGLYRESKGENRPKWKPPKL